MTFGLWNACALIELLTFCVLFDYDYEYYNYCNFLIYNCHSFIYYSQLSITKSPIHPIPIGMQCASGQYNEFCFTSMKYGLEKLPREPAERDHHIQGE